MDGENVHLEQEMKSRQEPVSCRRTPSDLSQGVQCCGASSRLSLTVVGQSCASVGVCGQRETTEPQTCSSFLWLLLLSLLLLDMVPLFRQLHFAQKKKKKSRRERRLPHSRFQQGETPMLLGLVWFPRQEPFRLGGSTLRIQKWRRRTVELGLSVFLFHAGLF